MTPSPKKPTTCEYGHTFYKSSDCPTCPTCEQGRKPESGFLAQLGAPARRALQHQGIDTLQLLSQYSENEILSIHGMGPGSMPKLRAALQEQGLSFKS
ncbi:RNA polymerase alpha subunit C-terminal domain-containing protein [Paenibacillus koleovorans]|uniref:RNA polymerase alpha subunit C-terminal domain-containing protein n=1 Tax=Paenibacillus koleovorans TaxID=121608 RepID=UPI000FDA5029|nr:RNA polymerase alpha subunit C-terminal domain-containing protein [Paenibacillus koleovorans]